ncbi:MAG TPA: PIN domain-containing protein [Chitinophagales bacterium]|nr:PIN domain-containing protein [Chitinophagales bacterium]
MGKKFLIDTNILIYYLNGTAPSNKEVENALLNNDFSISSITLTEILSWKSLSDDDVKLIIDRFSTIEIISPDRNISVHAAKIRRTNHVKLADAIIAATAIQLNIPLVSNDLSDFKEINDLQIIYPL